MANRAESIRQQEGLSVTRRGKRFIEFDRGNGKKRFVTTIEPLHYGDGTQEINTAFTADTGAFQWKMTAADFEVRTRDVLNSGNLVEFRKGAEFVVFNPLSLNWTNQDNSTQQISTTQAVSAQVTDDRIDWPAGFGSGRDFRYQAHPQRLIKLLTIQSAANLPAPTVTGPDIYLMLELQFTNSAGVELWLDGVRWARQANVRVSTANAIEFRSETTGETIWQMDVPTATDASGSFVKGLLQVRRQGGNSIATIRFPRSWVQSAVFPIVLDPTLNSQPDDTAAFDMMLYEPAPTTNYETFADLWVGDFASNGARGFLKWDLSSIGAGATYSSIELTVWLLATPDGSFTITVSRVLSGNSSVTESGATWDTQNGSDSWAGSVGCSTAGTDYSSTSMGSFAVSTSDAAGTSDVVSLDATEFEAMRANNFGMVLRPTTAVSFAKFRSANNGTSAERPQLVVDYTEAGGAVKRVLVRP